MNRESGLCSWFMNGEGACFLNGSRCDSPFSREGCDIQCEKIFHKEVDFTAKMNYKPKPKQEVITKNDAWRTAGIKVGDLVADCFIPYEDFEMNNVCPSLLIDHAWEKIDEKIKDANLNPDIAWQRLFHNVSMFDIGLVGVYMMGIIRRD